MVSKWTLDKLDGHIILWINEYIIEWIDGCIDRWMDG